MNERHVRRAMVERTASVGVAAPAGAPLLFACGGSSSSTNATGASGGAATTVSGSGGASLKLDVLTGNVTVARKSTFQAVCTASSGGSTSTITLGPLTCQAAVQHD
jgi:hypothetical protein